MKQRHSFTNLLYHMVFRTKLREHFITTPEVERALFGWADGVYAVTVDPENHDGLKAYIRNQRKHHEERTTITDWEPED